MSLAVMVGVLAGDDQDADAVEFYRQAFREVNRLLAAHGLPSHTEPESLPLEKHRGQLLSFPYSWLHYLRRAVAFARQAPEQFCPVPEDWDPSIDPRIDDEISDSKCHLICHSDTEGFYVPIDFPEPLYDDTDEKIPGGGIVGSSQRALQEAIEAAPLLGISLKNGQLSDEAANRIAEEQDESHPFWIERQVWLTMYEAFRESVADKCAVVFE
jgi:hypothetical protein